MERDDLPMNDGVKVVSGTEGYTQYSTEYPQKELKLSGAAIELEQKGQWKVIHHFRWNEDPGSGAPRAYRFTRYTVGRRAAGP